MDIVKLKQIVTKACGNTLQVKRLMLNPKPEDENTLLRLCTIPAHKQFIVDFFKSLENGAIEIGEPIIEEKAETPEVEKQVEENVEENVEETESPTSMQEKIIEETLSEELVSDDSEPVEVNEEFIEENVEEKVEEKVEKNVEEKPKRKERGKRK